MLSSRIPALPHSISTRSCRWLVALVLCLAAHTAVMDYAGRAFATAAGYLAHAICYNFCTGDRP